MFEDDEFQKPYQAFRDAGQEVVVVGEQGGQELRGYGGRVTHVTEAGIDEVRPDEFDALFVPGGYSPDHLRADPRMVDFARTMMESDKPVFAICHGPQLLLTAGAVRGRKMTAWQTVQGDLAKAGADVVDEAVVVDRDLVTSRKPDDIPAFVPAALEKLSAAPRSH
jgi:protease I